MVLSSLANGRGAQTKKGMLRFHFSYIETIVKHEFVISKHSNFSYSLFTSKFLDEEDVSKKRTEVLTLYIYDGFYGDDRYLQVTLKSGKYDPKTQYIILKRSHFQSE